MNYTITQQIIINIFKSRNYSRYWRFLTSIPIENKMNLSTE